MDDEKELSATEEFLKDLEPQNEENLLDKPVTEEAVEPEETAEEAESKLKNRREKRMAKQLQTNREAFIDLNARYQAITESQKLRGTTDEADYLKRIEKIYGDASPEAKEATELLKEALKGAVESAKREAVEEYESRRSNETNAVKREEAKLDEILENLEDEHDINLTDGPNRKGFLTLLEKLSPKDHDGNIKEYADPDATLELYLSRKEKGSQRAKELASRGMTRSGSSQPSKLEDDTNLKYLVENDLLF